MTWRKSSKSDSGGSCVEVRGDLAAIRDSKHPEVALPLSRPAVGRLSAFARNWRQEGRSD